MADERDFNDEVNTVTTSTDPEGYATGTSNFTTGTSTTCGWYPNTTYSYGSNWNNNYRTLTLKLKPSKELSVTEYYEEVYKLMSLLKDTNWNITSTKVKS